MLNRLMTPKEQLTLLFVGVALLVGGFAYYYGAARPAEVSAVVGEVVAATPSDTDSTKTPATPAPEPEAPSPRDAALAVEAEATAAESEPEVETATTAAVAIMGAVGREGLYRVPADTRVGELIDKAGGTTEVADLSDINLGARVIDGTTLTIPALPTKRTMDGAVQLRNNAPPVVNPPAYLRSQSAFMGATTAPTTNTGTPAASSTPAPGVQPGGLINLNTATQAELETLPGIGPALAQRIMDYRTQAAFTSVEDLDAVPGFGVKRVEQLRPLVTVQ